MHFYLDVPLIPVYDPEVMQTNGEFYADKLMDLANLAAAALIFGQLVENRIVWWAVGIGFSFLITIGVISFFLRKEKGENEK